MAHDAFISYSSRDKAVADAVCATLESRKIRCWIAPRDVPPGQTWSSALVEAIDTSRIFVLVLSAGSNKSQEVIREVGEAVDKGIPIIPLRIDNVQPSKEMGFYIKTIHWLDALTPPLEKHLRILGDRVQALLSVDTGEKQQIMPQEAIPTRLTVGELPARWRTWPRVIQVTFILLALLAVGGGSWWASSYLQERTKLAAQPTDAGVAASTKRDAASPPVAQTSIALAITPTQPGAVPLKLTSTSKDRSLSPDANTPTLTPFTFASGSTLGVLKVQTLKECDALKFDVKDGDNVISTGETDKEEFLLTGVFDIVLYPDFGKIITIEDVKIRSGEETIVDFGPKLGALIVTEYPGLDDTILYWVEPSDYEISGWYGLFLVSDKYICGFTDTYTIGFRGFSPDWSGYGGGGWQLAIFPSAMKLDVAFKAGEITLIEPKDWPHEFGLLSFVDDGNNGYNRYFEVQVYRLENSAQQEIGDGFTLFVDSSYWMLSGTYNLVITSPYIQIFENVEIKAGEETKLPLPPWPSTSNP